MAASGNLAKPNCIIIGDLNLSLLDDEVWGLKYESDPLATYFYDHFKKALLVDVVPTYMNPTWSNDRVGSAGVEKRIGCFLMDEGLDSSKGHSISCTIPMGIFYHKAVALQLGCDKGSSRYPFKFNCTWIADNYLFKFVNKCWSPYVEIQPSYSLFLLIKKIIFLRGKVIKWDHLAKNDNDKNRCKPKISLRFCEILSKPAYFLRHLSLQ